MHHRLKENLFIAKSAGAAADPVGFSNPVNIARLVRASTWHAEEPENVTEKRLEVLQDDEATWCAAQLKGYGYDTSVRTKCDGQDEDELIDSAKEQYRWSI